MTALALVDLLFAGYRRQVLGLLLLKPDQALHVRDIVCFTHTQSETLHRELSNLAYWLLAECAAE